MADGTVTKLFGLLPDLVVTSFFWRGMLLGLQENPEDETTLCLEAYDILYNLMSTLSFDFYDYA